MGVRPPQQDESDPDTVEFGIAALDARLEEAEVSFPVDRSELLRTLGDREIPVDAHGRTVELSTALQDTDRTEFDSEQELMNALHPVFETYRENSPTGFVASIRSLLPF